MPATNELLHSKYLRDRATGNVFEVVDVCADRVTLRPLAGGDNVTHDVDEMMMTFRAHEVGVPIPSNEED